MPGGWGPHQLCPQGSPRATEADSFLVERGGMCGQVRSRRAAAPWHCLPGLYWMPIASLSAGMLTKVECLGPVPGALGCLTRLSSPLQLCSQCWVAHSENCILVMEIHGGSTVCQAYHVPGSKQHPCTRELNSSWKSPQAGAWEVLSGAEKCYTSKRNRKGRDRHREGGGPE